MGTAEFPGLLKGAFHAGGHAVVAAFRGRIASLHGPQPGGEIPGGIVPDHGNAEIVGTLFRRLAPAQVFGQRLDIGIGEEACNFPAFFKQDLETDAGAGTAAHVHEQMIVLRSLVPAVCCLILFGLQGSLRSG